MTTTIPDRGTVIAVDPRTDVRWQALAAKDQGSLFTSPPWIRAVCDTYGFTPQARIFTDAAGCPTDGFAWVPISDIRGDRMVSLPFSDRAEPFIADRMAWSFLVDDALRAEMQGVARRIGDVVAVRQEHVAQAAARFERADQRGPDEAARTGDNDLHALTLAARARFCPSAASATIGP